MSFSGFTVFYLLSVASASRYLPLTEGLYQATKESWSSATEPSPMVFKGSGESVEFSEDEEQECRWTMYQGPEQRKQLFSSDAASLSNVVACKNMKGMFGYLSKDGLTCTYVNGTHIDSSQEFMVLSGCREVLFFNWFDPRNFREHGIVASKELQNYICRAFDTDCSVLGSIEKSTNICFAKCIKRNAICSHHSFQYLITDETARKPPLKGNKNIDTNDTYIYHNYCVNMEAKIPAQIAVALRKKG